MCQSFCVHLPHLPHLPHKSHEPHTAKGHWLATDALVLSVEWHDAEGDQYYHYAFAYSYCVGEEQYTGECCDYIDQQNKYLKPNDTISIRYCPERLATSFYPEAATAMNQHLLHCGLGVGTGFI